MDLDQRQGDVEFGARAVGWSETNPAALLLDYTPDDIEAEAGSLLLAFRGEERIEDCFGHCIGYSAARCLLP